ncbi:MAG: methyltransferase domain-containing protein [Nitrospinae bacterium]|jgi:ubiquinone/menaquinone biosynthesis C-methylase UbiE|nr:methyltransferase domain-containing protein [Nitrospinota bacterium]
MWGKFYQLNYWRLGFKTSLYDLLTPQAYRESARRCIQSIPIQKGQVLLDVGCGSGLLIEYLQDQLEFGVRYLGTDIQFPGLKRAMGKTPQGKELQTLFFNSDLTQPLPIKKESIDIIVAHFSLYTIIDVEIRKRILSNLKEILRPRGLMVIVNPSRQYDAKRIIRESAEEVRAQRGVWAAWTKRWLVYPFTYYLGLKFIERQLKQDKWQAFSLEELCEEIESVGLPVVHTESLYAGGAHLVTGRRPSETS